MGRREGCEGQTHEFYGEALLKVANQVCEEVNYLF